MAETGKVCLAAEPHRIRVVRECVLGKHEPVVQSFAVLPSMIRAVVSQVSGDRGECCGIEMKLSIDVE